MHGDDPYTYTLDDIVGGLLVFGLLCLLMSL